MMEIKKIAEIAHEVNKAYCESIGDNSQPEWGNAPAYKKESSIEGVKYYLENPDCSPEELHQNWMKDYLNNGWVYGEEKDELKKTHPCLVAYNKLPQDQKTKDYLFKAVVKASSKY